jgi:hypothetical protein
MDQNKFSDTHCSECKGYGYIPVLRGNGEKKLTPCWKCRAHISYGKGPTITVHGMNSNEVQEVSLALMEQSKLRHRLPNPWISGSFYLTVFLIVIVGLSVAGHLLPIFALPTVLVGGVIALSVVGALQMRHDEKLSEENFLKLMALSFKYLPWLRRRDTKSSMAIPRNTKPSHSE